MCLLLTYVYVYLSRYNYVSFDAFKWTVMELFIVPFNVPLNVPYKLALLFYVSFVRLSCVRCDLVYSGFLVVANCCCRYSFRFYLSFFFASLLSGGGIPGFE